MNILFLQGTGAASSRLAGHAVADLWRTARRCAHVLSFQSIASSDALIAALRSVATRGSDFVLLNPGDLASAHDAREDIRSALDSLAVPFVEVHGSSGAVLDLPLRADRQPVATIAIDGDLPSSCRIALGVALRRLSLRCTR